MSRILVIDDDDDVRGVVVESLKTAGHEVFSASNGAEGLAFQEKHGADLVITDLIMPEMEGIETIRAFHGAFPAVGIIAMSGGGRSLDARSYLSVARELGADIVLPKPFGAQALIDAVHKLLTTAKTL